jgi:RNA polymerase sigma-70 factor (ECF subfamily)
MDNQEWISSLVELYEKPLCRYAYSLTGSVSSAQDAVQETFLRLCKGDRNRIEGHEAAWLFQVCRSRVFDMKRKDKPVQALTPIQESQITASGPTPAEAAIHGEQEMLMPKLMSQLPDRQREAIRLKFQQSLSYREIARIMNISESNVGFLIHMGVKALRDHMKTIQGVVS